MGDRVCAYFTVPLIYKDAAIELLQESDPSYLDDCTLMDMDVAHFYIDDVNYGDVRDEINILMTNGIPCVYTHDSGGGFNGGTGHLLFASGKALHNFWYYTDNNPASVDIRAQLAIGQDALIQWLDEFDEVTRTHFTQEDINQGIAYKLKCKLGVK